MTLENTYTFSSEKVPLNISTVVKVFTLEWLECVRYVALNASNCIENFTCNDTDIRFRKHDSITVQENGQV